GGTPSRGGLHTLRTSQPSPLAGTTRGDHHTWRSTRRGFRRRPVRPTGGRARRRFACGSALILPLRGSVEVVDTGANFLSFRGEHPCSKASRSEERRVV